MKSQDPTAEQRRYWTSVASLGCLICRGPAELAHGHGPSLTARGFQKPKGKLFRWQHWFVIPLCPHHHRTGPISLDASTETWEATYGDVADWIDRLIQHTGIDVWAKARELIKQPARRSA